MFTTGRAGEKRAERWDRWGAGQGRDEQVRKTLRDRAAAGVVPVVRAHVHRVEHPVAVRVSPGPEGPARGSVALHLRDGQTVPDVGEPTREPVGVPDRLAVDDLHDLSAAVGRLVPLGVGPGQHGHVGRTVGLDAPVRDERTRCVVALGQQDELTTGVLRDTRTGRPGDGQAGLELAHRRAGVALVTGLAGPARAAAAIVPALLAPARRSARNHTGGIVGAVGVGAVDHTVAVLVEAVVAHLLHRRVAVVVVVGVQARRAGARRGPGLVDAPPVVVGGETGGNGGVALGVVRTAVRHGRVLAARVRVTRVHGAEVAVVAVRGRASAHPVRTSVADRARVAVVAGDGVVVVDAAEGGIAPVVGAVVVVVAGGDRARVDAAGHHVARVRGAEVVIEALHRRAGDAATVEAEVPVRAGVPVRTGHGVVAEDTAGDLIARVRGAHIAVVASNRGVGAARGRVAAVGGTSVAIVARDRRTLDARAVHAGVVEAGVPVVADELGAADAVAVEARVVRRTAVVVVARGVAVRRVRTTRGRVAGVVGASVPVVAGGSHVATPASQGVAEVGRAEVAVVALGRVRRRGAAGERIAGVGRAHVEVVAVDGPVRAARGRVAAVVSAEVAVVAVDDRRIARTRSAELGRTLIAVVAGHEVVVRLVLQAVAVVVDPVADLVRARVHVGAGQGVVVAVPELQLSPDRGEAHLLGLLLRQAAHAVTVLVGRDQVVVDDHLVGASADEQAREGHNKIGTLHLVSLTVSSSEKPQFKDREPG